MTARRHLFRWTLGTVAGLAALSVAGLVYLYLDFSRPLETPVRSAGPNAAWLAHKWVGKQQPDAAYDRLAAHLKRHRITDAFFHVGPLQADGTIAASRYPAAAHLVQQLRARMPSLRTQAWIGQVEKRGGGPLDLSDPAVRARIVETAGDFLVLGFGGIHYNIEPSTGNPHLLDLLDATRPLTRAKGAALSMATDELEPAPGLAWMTRIAGTYAGFWTEGYYRAVMDRVDQVAIMMYDTALPADWLYGSLAAWETRAVMALAPESVTVFVGAPTYEEHRFSFDPAAENLRSALRGIRKGMSPVPAPRRQNAGVAIYAHWTTDDAEWRHYRETWLGLTD